MSKIHLNPSAQSLTDCMHLFTLASFAFAQPLYDILGQNPEFFVAHQSGPFQIVSMVLILSVGLALFFIAIELTARIFGNRSRRIVHIMLVFLLVALIVAPLSKPWTGDNDLIMSVFVLAVTLFFIVLYVRLSVVRVFITVLMPVIFVFPLWFIWGTPVARLVMPQALEMNTDITVKNPVPVTIVVLDEFTTTALLDSGGKIDPVRFPNFAEFATESFWFPNAVMASQSTVEAIPSLLTGRNPRPKERLTPIATDYPENLFAMIDGTYSFNLSEAMTMLSPDSKVNDSNIALLSDIAVIYLHLIAPPNVSLRLPALEARWGGFGQEIIKNNSTEYQDHSIENRVEKQQQFLSQIKSNSKPGLNFIHTLMPHIPYHYLASGHRYSRDQKLPEGIISDRVGWLGEEPLIITAYLRFLQQVGYVDTFLGQLKDKLISEGIYDESLVIITADHGVAFQPFQSRRVISDSNVIEILKVPMFIKLPGQKDARVDDRIVSSIDVLPTIIDVLEVTVPWNLDGLSMISDVRPLRTGIEITGVGYFTAGDIKAFPRLEWQVENFGERTPLNQLVSKGPYYELARRNVDDFKIGGMVDMSLKSNDIDHFQDVNIESDFIPSLFTGYIEGSDAQKLPIAITVNGIISATTYTSEWDEHKNYFSVLLPSNVFLQGRNDVDVYLIDQSENGLSLLPFEKGRLLDITFRREQIVKEILTLSSGHEVLVETHRNDMDGYLDWLTLEDGMLIFEGWAADLVEGQPASNVLIFKGKILVSQVVPTYKREGLVKVFKRPTLLRSGYRAIVPLRILESHSGDISVIAISKDKRAFRLQFKDAHKELIRRTLSR